jgi:hypothetical protein
VKQQGVRAGVEKAEKAMVNKTLILGRKNSFKNIVRQSRQGIPRLKTGVESV